MLEERYGGYKQQTPNQVTTIYWKMFQHKQAEDYHVVKNVIHERKISFNIPELYIFAALHSSVFIELRTNF